MMACEPCGAHVNHVLLDVEETTQSFKVFVKDVGFFFADGSHDDKIGPDEESLIAAVVEQAQTPGQMQPHIGDAAAFVTSSAFEQFVMPARQADKVIVRFPDDRIIIETE